LEFSGAEKISREQEGEKEEPCRKDSHLMGNERIGIGYLEHNGGRFSMGKKGRRRRFLGAWFRDGLRDALKI